MTWADDEHSPDSCLADLVDRVSEHFLTNDELGDQQGTLRATLTLIVADANYPFFVRPAGIGGCGNGKSLSMGHFVTTLQKIVRSM